MGKRTMLLLVALLAVVGLAGCAALMEALFEGGEQAPVVVATRGIAPALPITWGEGVTGAGWLAQNAYLLWRRFRTRQPSA